MDASGVRGVGELECRRCGEGEGAGAGEVWASVSGLSWRGGCASLSGLEVFGDVVVGRWFGSGRCTGRW